MYSGPERADGGSDGEFGGDLRFWMGSLSKPGYTEKLLAYRVSFWAAPAPVGGWRRFQCPPTLRQGVSGYEEEFYVAAARLRRAAATGRSAPKRRSGQNLSLWY
jgi:hypothetical protein